MEQQFSKEHLIFWVEQVDSSGVSPFRIVETIQQQGYSRPEAIEIYRIGSSAWSVPEEEPAEEV